MRSLSLLLILALLSLLQAELNVGTFNDNGGKRFSNLYRNNLHRLVHQLSEEVQPCEDFFQHACGDFGSSAEDEDSAEASTADASAPPFLYNLEDRRHFFEENSGKFGTRVGQLMRDVYNDCRQRPSGDQWRDMLQQVDFLAVHATLYRKWPLLHYQWKLLVKVAPVNWIPLAAQLAAHGVFSVLHIFFADHTIFIAPISDVVCPGYDELTASLQHLMPHRSAQIAKVIGGELWSFCRELMGELPLSGEIYVVENDTNIFNDDNINVYFETFFSLLNLTEAEVAQARKIPVDPKRLSEVLTVLRTTEPRIVFNFVLWRAREQLKYEDCFALTDEFEDMLLSEYWHWYVFEEHFGREVAMAMYLFHTTRFQRHRRDILMGEHWYRFLFVQLKRKDFNLARVIKQYAHTNLDAEDLSKIYDVAPFKRDAFYGNLLKLRRLQLRNTFFADVVDPEDLNHPAYFLRQFLHFCVLQLKQPLFHYFATLGFHLWYDSDLLYSSDGFYTALDCLERQTLLNWHDDDDESLFKPSDESEVKELFHFYSAFIESYRDYQFWLEGESFAFAEDYVLEFFEMNSKRILFYAVAQLYCGRNDSVYRLQINRSFMNMPQFQEAFNCSSEAAMNPLVKCMIRNCS